MAAVQQGVILYNDQVSPDMYEMELLVPAIAPLCQPGQFVHVRPGIHYDPLLRRPLSLYDVDKDRGTITLLYKVVGAGTEMIAHLNRDEHLDVMGPLGRPFWIPDSPCRTVLVGGGVGIAPLIYLARVLKSRGCTVQVLYGTATGDQLTALPRLNQIGVESLVATLDGSHGHSGLVTDILWKQLEPADIDLVYTCGPEAMMASVADYVHAHGLEGEVSLEEHMACGVGACLGCARKLKPEDSSYVKVCKDGPVFSMREVQLPTGC